jgi:hypothetical protein
MKATSKPEQGSPLLNIIAEVRLAIWKFALPCSKYLVLDPDYAQTPGPFHPGDYEAAASLLRVCKQVYNEILPLLYSRNTVAILEPSAEDINPFTTIPQDALQHITQAEFHLTNSLSQMGPSSQFVLTGKLPSLKRLRLNFWHGRFWLQNAMELAYRSWSDRNFIFKLELHQSVWDGEYLGDLDVDIIGENMELARDNARIYDLKLPASIETITLSASVGSNAAYEFATYQTDKYPTGSDRKINWRFNKDGNKDTATVKYLVWGQPTNIAG